MEKQLSQYIFLSDLPGDNINRLIRFHVSLLYNNQTFCVYIFTTFQSFDAVGWVASGL